jgi:GTP cyclohydrolase II
MARVSSDLNFKFSPAVRQRVKIPLVLGEANFISFSGLSDAKEHFAIEFKRNDFNQAPLVRMHSECITGDLFGSKKCDCGPQLEEALQKLKVEGGYLLYMRQEGRGIGLYNKLDTYILQDLGRDTYEANEILGYSFDLRSYEPAAEMLKALDLRRIRLLSNNPDKANQLRSFGIEIAELVSTQTFLNPMNARYLNTKKDRTGHRLCLQPERVLL